MKFSDSIFIFFTFSTFLLYILLKTIIQYLIFADISQNVLLGEMNRNIYCIESRTQNLNSHQLWAHFEGIINDCSPRRFLRINRYQNFDEFKFFKPKTGQDQENCTIVTLGVGRDVVAERTLKFQHPECRFVGADPVRFINEILYREIGEFHNIAVGIYNGTMNTLVYRGHNYTNESVPAVDLPYFLKDMVETTVIDLLLIDVEYGEYEMFEYFLGGELEQLGITVCQVNIEVHIPKEEHRHKQKFAEFVRKLVKDRKYYLIEASTFHDNKRIFFSRLDHSACD